MKKRIIIICTIIIFLVGCLTSPREGFIKAGYDPNYADGYEQGWFSGHVAAGYPYCSFQKNTHRYENDSQYKQGWNDGFAVGKGRYESIGRSMR